MAARVVEHRGLQPGQLAGEIPAHRLALGRVELGVKGTGENEEGQSAIPFAKQSRGQCGLAHAHLLLPVDRRLGSRRSKQIT